MKILHVVADHGDPGAGIHQAIEAMSRQMVERGHEVTLAFTGTPLEDDPGIRRIAFPRRFPRCLYHSPALRRALPELLKSSDLMHVHSDWTYPVWLGCEEGRRAGKALIHSSHGCLDPLKLKHRAWKKALAAPLDRRALSLPDCLLAASMLEAGWIRDWVSGHAERIRVCPLGLDLTRFPVSGPESWERQLLFVGRLHPLKGLDLLLEAWATARETLSGWRLRIVGPDEQGTRAVLQAQAVKLGIGEAIEFCGALSHEETMAILRRSHSLVLPSRSENFGLAVAEALACGIPVLTTTGTPWLSLETDQCGWVVECHADALAEGLRRVVTVAPEDRRHMGHSARVFAERHLDGSRLAEKLETIYLDTIKASRRKI